MLNFKRILVVFFVMTTLSAFLIGYFSVTITAKKTALVPTNAKQAFKTPTIGDINNYMSNLQKRTSPIPNIPSPLAGLLPKYMKTPTSEIQMRSTPYNQVTPFIGPPVTITIEPQPTQTPGYYNANIQQFPSRGVAISSVFTHPLPLTNSSIIRTLEAGEIVTIIGNYNGWYKLIDGSYVYKSFITLTTESSSQTVNTPRPSPKTSRGEDRTDIQTKSHTIKIDSISNLSREEISIIIKNTNFKNSADAIYDCEKQFSVNAFFIVGTAKEESANGFSSLARTKNNLFGIKNGNSYRYFDSFSESFYGFASLIRKYYFNKGLTTLSKVQRVYCENGSWDENILDIIHGDLKKVTQQH